VADCGRLWQIVADCGRLFQICSGVQQLMLLQSSSRRDQTPNAVSRVYIVCIVQLPHSKIEHQNTNFGIFLRALVCKM
jgi:hypothetical protein